MEIYNQNMQREEISYKLIFNKRNAFLSSAGLSLIINSVLVLCLFFMSFRSNSSVMLSLGESVRFFVVLFIGDIILLYLLYNINHRIIKNAKSQKKTLILILLGTVLTCCFCSPVLSQIQWIVLDDLDNETNFEVFASFNLIKDIILGVLALFEIGLRYNNYCREQTLIMNQKLMEENIRTRYEALKNQLDPHFLFNSLNTLNGLIGMDDEKAHDYVDNLSSIFRYTLHSKTICKLSEEIEFANSYINLLKIRYGKNLMVRYEMDEKYQHWYMMPVSIQLLIENVIKHNTISNKKPLRILIQTTGRDSIIVENIINLKINDGLSGGVGLSNLSDRYDILFGKTITITNNGHVFAVEIPLIREINKKYLS
ncbi:MAG: sensor histidine kinase [Tannerella sp.]|jgi:sensor histidine kinase YesM|nr:sensor histidine kinase [Tannerella sp.]